MNILVTGASGFIAAQIVTDLLRSGHNVTCAVRNPAYAQRLFPTATVLPCDFIKDTCVTRWQSRLTGIDVVINCVGILYHPNKKVIWAIHYDTPRALFEACVLAGVAKVVQISALGVDDSPVDYATSKKAADDYLLSLPIQAIILRPSLVYGRGSYGGSSLFRGLSGLPWLLPVPGRGTQTFQPLHVQDLSKALGRLILQPPGPSVILAAVGPKQIELLGILKKMRAWLGFAEATVVFIPLLFIRVAAKVGDLIPYSAMNSTAYRMLLKNNVSALADMQKFHDHIGFIPRDFEQGMDRQPSTVQDHWHSRLYFLKPLTQLSLAFLWIASGVCSAFFYQTALSYDLLAQVGVTPFWQPLLLYGASFFDIALGLAMLCGYQLKKVALLQLLSMVFYTVLISWRLPLLWLEPFAPVVKNIPIVMLTLVFLVMESDR